MDCLRGVSAFFCVIFVTISAGRLAADTDHVHPGGWDASRPDSHAPIGVMGDHVHAGGEWMLSYRYMPMMMAGNRDGAETITPEDVFARGFMVAPLEMSMQMHMFGLMVAPSDRLTLMGMVNVLDVSMDHRTASGMEFTTETSGIGDTRLAGLVVLHRWGLNQLHANIGVSLPTGSVDERGATPMGPDQKLPYPMQLGSGTFDFLPGLTMLGQVQRWSWGLQGIAVARAGENDEGYTLVNELLLNAWAARTWNDWWSSSLRLSHRMWGDIDGADPELNPMMVPTARTDLRGGNRLEAGFGTNLYIRGGPLAGHRLAVEVNLPLYRSLDGPQLETDWTATVGWQKAF